MGRGLEMSEIRSGMRYDADWVRILAFGFLILHHAAAAFQPWGGHLLLIWNERPLFGLPQLVDWISVWGIPLLFMASGMGLRLAMTRGGAGRLFGDLVLRIFIPLLFGTFAVGPLYLAMAVGYYYGKAYYVPNPGHLWFLGNLLIYMLLLLPVVIWAKRRPDNRLVRGFDGFVGAGLGMVIVLAPAVLEALLVNPTDYASYAFRLHGFVLGLICFCLGFLFVSTEETAKRSAERVRFGALALSCGLHLARLLGFWNPLNALLALESMSWMIAVWGFASRHLDKPSKVLVYLSSAVFPIYILHVPVQVFVSSHLMPLGIHPLPKFLLLVVLTLSGSLGLYEIVRRIRWIRPFFGMEWTRRTGPSRRREAA